MQKDTKNTAIFIAFDDYAPFDPSAPEKNLLKAVLMSALGDLRKQGEPCRRAVEYFLSPEEDYIFSFRSVCSFLNLDPQTVFAITGIEEAAKSEGVVQAETSEQVQESPADH